MADLTAANLTVVIPTRDRWTVLAQTLDALANQSTQGFELVVVVDGDDQVVPGSVASTADRILVQPHGGPGAARNRGVGATDRPLILFLGDDIIPTVGLVEAHLQAHATHPEVESGALGYTDWHPDVATGIHNRWLSWSSSQFDYRNIQGDEAGWGRFYSSNVSLKRELFDLAGGFDEAFTYDYEDLDLAYRLHELGLRLWYAPQARAQHLHRYDWQALTRRYHSRGQAERQMAEKHAWFEPWFAARLRSAQEAPPGSAAWARLAVFTARIPAAVRQRIENRGTTWYHQTLAAPFFGSWNGHDDLAELREYLGDEFDPDRLHRHRQLVDEEERDAPDERTFYKTGTAYLYDLTMFALWGTKEPYLAALRRLVPREAHLLDYGCGIGSDGLRLMDSGYQVEFADFDNPSTKYLRWRLSRRGRNAAVHDIEADVPTGFDVVYSFDVIEHVDDPWAFLSELENRAELVFVNFLAPDPADTHLHRPLPVRRLVNYATRRGLVLYHCYEGRSHLVAYHSRRSLTRPTAFRSWGRRLRGELLAATERLARLPG